MCNSNTLLSVLIVIYSCCYYLFLRRTDPASCSQRNQVSSSGILTKPVINTYSRSYRDNRTTPTATLAAPLISFLTPTEIELTKPAAKQESDDDILEQALSKYVSRRQRHLYDTSARYPYKTTYVPIFYAY